MASHKWPAAVGNDCSPQEQSEKGRRNDDTFDQEEYAELLDGQACKNCLENPVNELKVISWLFKKGRSVQAHEAEKPS